MDVEIVFGRVPEPYFLTFLPSILHCSLLVIKEDADVVTSVSNPFHLQLVGYVVSVFTRRKWIAEFRDPMVENPDRDPDEFITKVAAFVERLAATRATQIVWGNGMQIPDEYFQQSYGLTSDRVEKLPFQGFDPADFDNRDAVEYDSFTITYAGSFYEGWIEPYRFIDGVEQHVAEYSDDSLRVQFYGEWSKEYQQAVERAGIDDIVEHFDFVPHEEIIPVLKGSDLVLYIGGDNADNRLNVPSKIWDYIGARTPILAVVDTSFRVAEMIMTYELGLVAEPDDPQVIADAIAAIRSGEYKYDPDPEAFNFTRDAKFQRLAEIYSQTANESR
jgi:glycosyltransferase involved in cell wall biosynthesis